MGRGDVICARIDVDADTVGDAVVDDAVVDDAVVDDAVGDADSDA